MFRGFFVAALLVAFAAPVVAAVVYAAGSDDRARSSARSRQSQATPRPPAPPVNFAGRTSQQLLISFDLAFGGRRIEGLHVTYKADCGKALAFELADKFFTPVAVAADGSFSVRGVGKRLSFSGRIADGQASGRVRVDYDYGGFLKCVTPELRWSAAEL